MRALAIIGGGASATLLLAHLKRTGAPRDTVIDVYDRDGAFARGIAYRTDDPQHLLNVRAGNMSGLVDAPLHFAEFAAGHGVMHDGFAPRGLYGAYLETLWADAEAYFQLRRVTADVLSCARGGAGYALRYGEGAVSSYDAAILASGNVNALAPPLATEGVMTIEGYHADPWRMRNAEITALRQVLICGTGLTAIDMALRVARLAPAASITMVSRHGLLPQRHKAAAPFVLDWMAVRPKDPLAFARELRRQARSEQHKTDGNWRAVIDSVRPYTNALWQSWPAAAQAKARGKLATFWNVHRHRMAPEIAEKLTALRTQGQVRLVTGAITAVQSDAILRAPVLRLKDGRQLPADAIINCLGYGAGVERGRSFAVTARIGPARLGELWETTAIPEIRAQAAELAAELAAALIKDAS